MSFEPTAVMYLGYNVLSGSSSGVWCWSLFLYDCFSLCEHVFAVDVVITLTVINCCIFSLNSTDGQSEVRVWSTKTIRNSRMAAISTGHEELRSFSSFWVNHHQQLVELGLTLHLMETVCPATTDWDPGVWVRMTWEHEPEEKSCS